MTDKAYFYAVILVFTSPFCLMGQETNRERFASRLAKRDYDASLQLLNATIGKLNSVCELNEEQARHLKVAAKGAAKTSSEAYRARWLAKDDVQPGRLTITQEKLWKNAIKNVLNAEQSKKWHAEDKRQQEFQRKALIEFALSLLDWKVPLSSKQRAAVRNHLEQTVAIRKTDWNGLVHPAVVLDEDVFPMLLDLSSDELNKILKPEQVAPWHEFTKEFVNARLELRKKQK